MSHRLPPALPCGGELGMALAVPQVELAELLGAGLDVLLGGVHIVGHLRGIHTEDELIAVELEQVALVVHVHAVPGLEAGLQVGGDHQVVLAAGVELDNLALALHIIGELLIDGHEHLPGSGQGEEGSTLAAPVVVQGDLVDGGIPLADVVDVGEVDLLADLGAQLDDGVHLILVDPGHGGGHQGAAVHFPLEGKHFHIRPEPAAPTRWE